MDNLGKTGGRSSSKAEGRQRTRTVGRCALLVVSFPARAYSLRYRFSVSWPSSVHAQPKHNKRQRAHWKEMLCRFHTVSPPLSATILVLQKHNHQTRRLRHRDARKSMPLVPQHHLTNRRRHIGPPSQGAQLVPRSQPQRWQTNRRVPLRTSSGIPSPPNEAGNQRGRASPAYRTSATATVEPIHPSLHSCSEVPTAREGRGGTSARRRERSHKETTAVATL